MNKILTNCYQISFQIVDVVNGFEGKADGADVLAELDRLLRDGDPHVEVGLLAQILRMNLKPNR